MGIMNDFRLRLLRQCAKPTGLLGAYVALRMNISHARLTAWGLSHVSIRNDDAILDIGCGGGRTVKRLAALAPAGTVVGIDVSRESVALSRRVNRQTIREGRVAIREASVSRLPFADDAFTLATAVETHYFWPDFAAGLGEVLRVLAPGGRLILIAEVYRCDKFDARNREWLKMVPMAYYDVGDFRNFFCAAGFVDVRIHEEPDQGWLCGLGRKPSPAPATAAGAP